MLILRTGAHGILYFKKRKLAGHSKLVLQAGPDADSAALGRHRGMAKVNAMGLPLSTRSSPTKASDRTKK